MKLFCYVFTVVMSPAILAGYLFQCLSSAFCAGKWLWDCTEEWLGNKVEGRR